VLQTEGRPTEQRSKNVEGRVTASNQGAHLCLQGSIVNFVVLMGTWLPGEVSSMVTFLLEKQMPPVLLKIVLKLSSTTSPY